MFTCRRRARTIRPIMEKIKALLLGAAAASILAFGAGCSKSGGSPKIIEKDGARLYEFTAGKSKFLANPEEGALLMKWDIARPDGSVRRVLHWDDAKVRGDITNVWGGAPVFFPFCGISFGDGKPNMWKSPRGEVLPMRKFGFADCGKFEIAEVSATSIKMRFLPDEMARKSYPFKYNLYVKYTFRPRSYTLEMFLENKDNIALPWGPGHHPFIAVPWNKGETNADYRIYVDCEHAWNIDNKHGRLIDVPFQKDNPLDGSVKVSGQLFTKLNSATAKIGPKNGKEDVRITFNDGKVDPLNCFVVFGKPGQRPYWALEPWSVPPLAAGNNAPTVPAGQVGKFKIDVSL